MDFYDKARLKELNKRTREELGFYIIPSTNIIVLYFPNFFTEGKGLKGDTPIYKNQVLYDGTLNTRRIYELRLYINLETAYDNNFYTIISTYYSGSRALKLYIIYYILSINPNRDYKYHIT